ncbi:apolipoprotein L2-like isoform X2 [Micropterus dolomieu]|uniref:apolipoprotein L2-like isoform X2 n=1 Tax=Micropterus dolomieu TaxID=147949 RepID=UPI001E8E258B|nr:apolipoprotein L2-like isoform X2 [Micropterus dolomieu]
MQPRSSNIKATNLWTLMLKKRSLFLPAMQPRDKLQEALMCYTKDTLSYINIVTEFCEDLPQWTKARRTELTKIKDDLTAVLKDTLGGLKKLDCFLDAVEKLAVTSLHVFKKENQVLQLPRGISCEQVQVVISSARQICPLLLKFKRDASVFFLPKLQNVEVLSYQLDKYIETTQSICDKLEKSDFPLRMTTETTLDLDVDLSEDDIQRMLHHINQLEKIRMDQDFRMVFLFQGKSCSVFTSEFRKRQPEMLQFLHKLEECAVQLDKMNKGAKISSVAGSSVGAVGCVLSLVGLALIPFTAGGSLCLLIGGTALGITSGVNSVVTTATEIGVNYTKQKIASDVFHSFMKDVQVLQDCLEDVTSQTVPNVEPSMKDVGKGAAMQGVKVGGILRRVEELITSAGKAGKTLRNVPRTASEISDIGQVAVKGSLALSKTARFCEIAASGLFLGLDIYAICTDSISLAKGSETEVSQLIRARAALWRSEIESWQKIHDSLCKGQLTSEEKRAVLETPF